MDKPKPKPVPVEELAIPQFPVRPPPLTEDEYHTQMREALDSVVLGTRKTRPVPSDGQQANQYHGTPCRRCGGTLRYQSNRGCVACQSNQRWTSLDGPARPRRAEPGRPPTIREKNRWGLR